MLNLPIVKWHIQELHKLLIVEPNNPVIVPLLVQLETMLNNELLRRVEAAAPDISEAKN